MKNSKSLLITLGHNSSAIFVDGKTVIGYEQERLSGIKADSQFPIDAINEIIHNVGIKNFDGCKAFISHWFNAQKDGYEFKPSKYMSQNDYDFLEAHCDSIKFVDSEFTHHDAHAWSALAFFNYFYDSQDRDFNALMESKQLYTIVADGFGTNKEVVSIYESHYAKDKAPKLIHRVYGYDASLGLMYQYATSFCGMKENQDEYKFLGYEAHIRDYFSTKEIECLRKYATAITTKLLYLAEQNTSAADVEMLDDIFDSRELKVTRKTWHDVFSRIVEEMHIDKKDAFKLRVAIAYIIQTVIESYFVAFIGMYNMRNVICVGGCFYNVKLNNAILENTDGLFSVMPLAGDQGAAIGMFYKFTNEQFPFNTLAIGKRRLFNIEKCLPKNAKYVRTRSQLTENELAHEIALQISNGKIVNLIYGNMEFGPRALCNTSTLMLPTAENVANNNRMNNRNEVMPCAPVCSEDFVVELFDEEELSRVVGSDKFMICTHTYTKEFSAQYAGVMHNKPLVSDEYTGRPQIVKPYSFIGKILHYVNEICDAKCIVNTSFNAHGRPIVFDTTSIIQNFEYQCEHSDENKVPILYIVDTNFDNE